MILHSKYQTNLKCIVFSLVFSLACYGLNLIGLHTFIFAGEGDVIYYLQYILEIGAYKVLVVSAPVLVVNHYHTCPGSRLDEQSNSRRTRRNHARLTIDNAFRCGIYAFMACIVFIMLLHTVLPMISTDPKRLAELIEGQHASLYTEPNTLKIMFFYGTNMFFISAFLSVVYATIRKFSSSKSLPYPATLLVLQVLSLGADILRLPAQYRITHLYTGNYLLWYSQWPNLGLLALYFFIVGSPFITSLYLRGRWERAKRIQQ